MDPTGPLVSQPIVQIDGVVTGLDFAANGDLFYITQNGGVYRKAAVDGELQNDEPPRRLLQLAVAEGTETGLLGLALAGDFADSGHLFLFYTVADEAGAPAGARLERYTLQTNQLTAPVAIVTNLPATAEQQYHYGGALQLGPDGRLYLIFGDRNMLPEARDPATVPGSILRFNIDGSIPADNPFPGSPVYAYGIRNGFGLAWDGAGRLYETENGASCDDELNLILPGADYGWGVHPYDSCPYPDDTGQPPVQQWTQIIAPAGLTFYDGQRLPEFAGDLLLCAFNQSQLRHLELNEAGTEVVREEIVTVPGIIDPCRVVVRSGLDGWLYMANGRMIHRLGR
ncbi:MAG: PQQ-dependent sugar dehydrogenase [Anaerolineales bacterium]|nr:PQQ-dependent sugar dehydrogenase [Anaerolineales bacterium]